MRSGILRKQIERLLLALGLPDAELSVLFAGDRAMRALNNRYRGKDRVTDVLSFSFREGAHPSIQPHHLGDIVIAVPEAVRQARRAGHSVEREIELLLVHGLLHLAGYDHEKGLSETNRMRNKERTLHRLLAARRR